MRKIEYLSPTSIAKFYEDQREFYLAYLADDRPAKIPQTRPMSVGSAFDAYAKSYLHEKLFGRGSDPKFDFNAIFEAQVEEQNRDWAREAGKHCFEVYHQSGAMADLLLELGQAVGTPRFELEVRGVIDGRREGVTLDVGGVTLLGKPDVFFLNRAGAHVILDWKVNGYCSNYGASPMKGYVRLRNERSQNEGQHKDCQLMMVDGVMTNVSAFLEHFDESWARQLSIYGWLCGCQIGEQFIVAVDQLACRPAGARPSVRVAEHRLRVHRDYQWRVFAQAQHVWEVVHSDHFFRDLSKEDSAIRCKQLDGMAAALRGEGTDLDRWFEQATRG